MSIVIHIDPGPDGGAGRNLRPDSVSCASMDTEKPTPGKWHEVRLVGQPSPCDVLLTSRYVPARLHAGACLRATRATGILPVSIGGAQVFSHVPVTRIPHGLSMG